MRSIELVDAACQRAGLSEFGPDEADMREALDVLLASADSEADLRPEAEQRFRAMVEAILLRRLEIERYLSSRPEILEQTVDSVLFGVGLPRTGSTALSFLLAQDSRTRSLRGWEAEQPVPPPILAEEQQDPRYLAAVSKFADAGRVPAEIRAMVPTSADGPAECLELMTPSFRSSKLDAMAKLPTYGQWLTTCDYRSTYRYHERLLKLLQWRRPPTRWRLKTPAHMWGIADLHAVYPEARYVITHREPAAVIPSVARFNHLVSQMTTGSGDMPYWGAHCTEIWDAGLRNFMAFRDAVAEDRCYDIGYLDLQADPIGTVRDLYDWLGEELTSDTENDMRAWWDRSQAERRAGGGNTYDLGDYGLDRHELGERFAYYSERYPMATEVTR